MERNPKDQNFNYSSEQMLLQEENELLIGEETNIEHEKKILLGNLVDYLETYGDFDDN